MTGGTIARPLMARPEPPCPLCDQAVTERGHTAAMERIWCPCCGNYAISDTTVQILRNDAVLAARRYLLSGLTRRASDNGAPLRIVSEELDELLRIAPEPRTPFQAIDRLLLVIHQRANDLRGEASFENATDYPLLFVRNATAAKWVLDQACAQELLEVAMRVRQREGLGHANERVICLTLPGWARVQELQSVGVLTDQAFVAMSFHPDLDAARGDGFIPALEATGYRPMILTEHEHNGLIDDVILSEIRRSGLVVVDFTRHPGGAYFEAGFAMGLGLPVIRTCREADFVGLHFDVNHYNVIRWTEPSDLREKLERRIRATIPGRAAGQTEA